MGRLPLPPGGHSDITVRQVGTVWVARCRYRRMDGTYVDVRRRGPNKEKARAAVRGALGDLAASTPGSAGELKTSALFSKAAELWMAQFRQDAENGIYSLNSADVYADTLRCHVLPALGALRLVEVKPAIVNALCQGKLRSGSLSQAKQVRAVVSNVFTMVVQAGVLDQNPVRDIAPLTERRAKVKKGRSRALTREELLDLLAKLDTDEQAVAADLPDLIRYFVATGERSGEALGAIWSDFDEAARALTMSGNIIQARGKGTVRNKGKTETAQRPIPLADWSVRMLSERRQRMGVAPASPAPIFPNTQGGFLNASNLRNRHLRPFLKRSGYEWVTLRAFRRTVATLLDKAGLSAREIAAILGHAKPSMTQDVYMDRGQTSRAGADALDSILTDLEGQS